MRKHLVKVLSTCIVCVACGFSLSASAGIEVKFVEPKKFRDIDISGLNKKRSIAMVKTQIERLFNDIALETLSESETLVIEVTNIDLAGYMDYFFGPDRKDLRIIRNNDRYRLEFNYRLTDKDGKVSKQGQADIKEFLKREPRQIRHSKYQTISYMRDDIIEWMKKSLRE